jgi:hypothetical protein
MYNRKAKEKGGEPAYRFNWDAPLIISKFDNKRIYFAANTSTSTSAPFGRALTATAERAG